MNYLTLLKYGLLVAIIWLLCVVGYRIYLHPLAKIPGPRITAVSRFYEFYCDCVRRGMFWKEIEKWHQLYGPIIRIGPNEVHIDDPEWFNELYNTKTKLDKDPYFYGLLGNNDSAFATIEHDIHRIKRERQNPYFSRQKIDGAASMMSDTLSTLLDRLECYRGTGQPFNLRYAIKSFTADVASGYCFPQGMRFVQTPDFSKNFHDARGQFARICIWMRHFPMIGHLALNIPDWAVRYMDQGAQAAMGFLKVLELQVEASIRQSDENGPNIRKTVIRDLYESDLPELYRTKQVLNQEAVALVGAGIATTSQIIEAGIFHILNTPSIAERLIAETRAYKPEVKRLLTQRELESLPYLNAVVLEMQRAIPGVVTRPPRINRTQDMMYGSYCLPKGTIVGTGIYNVLLSEKVWGNARKFDPSRWLDLEYKKNMQKYMVPFSRGSRNCVGQNLAIAEIYVVIGNFFRRFDAELFKSSLHEVELVHDYFDPQPARDTTGIRVLLK